MKKLSRLIAIILSITLLMTTIPAFAGYAVSSLVNNVSRTKWMNEIKDDTLLSDISIPGTHDSAARIVDSIAGAWAQTQAMTISDQLNAGVRFLDLRVRYNTDVYYNVEMCHSSITIWNGNGGHLTLYEVIGNIKDFLKNNPTETVIVCIKEDDGSNESNIVKEINNIKNEDPSFWYQSYNTPKLGDVRGKMVVASRMSTMPGIYWGWGDQGSDGSYVQTYSNAIIQDRYNMGTTAKWNDAIVPTFNYAKKSGQWVINCLNTTGGGISGVLPNANTINPAFGRYDLHNNKCYGIVTFDYITDDQTTKVIKCNDLVTKRQPNPENKEYYYRLNVNNPDSVPSGWTSCSLRLYYKANNGTGYEGSELLFQNGDTYNGYAFVCQTGNYEFSGKLSGFPSAVAFQYDWGYGSDRLELDFKLYVSDSPNGTYTQVMDTFFARTSGISSPQAGTDIFYVDSSKYPTPSSVSFYNDSQTNITAPLVDSGETKSNTFNAKVYDQFGVRWYQDASSYSLSKSINGMSFDGNTLKTTEQANDNVNNTDAYVLASYSYGGKTLTTPSYKKVVLTTNPIPYSFVDLNDEVIATGEGYYGSVPVFNSTTNPTQDPTDTLHYTFSSWTPTTVSTSNRVFKPVYNIEPHTMRTLHQDATCTEGGYNHIYCADCDYVQSDESYSPLDHDYANAVKGEHIDSKQGENGFFPYYCPRCNDELVELREYDENDYSAYLAALKSFNDITLDEYYHDYNDDARNKLEDAIGQATMLDLQDKVYQYDIDNASALILSAIDEFSEAIGVSFYNVSFVSVNNIVINTLYREGTPASDVRVPASTPTLVTDTTHTVYSWQKIYDVTAPATYYELATKSYHTYNTFIFPDVVVPPTTTEQGSITHKCLCGYTYTEYVPVLELDVEIVYILDNEVLRKETKTAPLGANIDIEIPSEYSYYKTTIENNGVTTRLPSTSIIIDNNCEIVVYLYNN